MTSGLQPPRASVVLRLSREGFGRVDLHHLNAGIPASLGGFPDLTAEEFDRVMAVNVRGVFLGLRGAFRAQGSAHGTAIGRRGRVGLHGLG